jgi:tRNA modification GTPase
MKPSEYDLDEPIVAIATALVPSALGIVRTSGKGAIDLVARAFSRPEALRSANGGTLVHGWVLSPAKDIAGEKVDSAEREKVDEVVLAVYRAPKSFTGEDAVEITGHGGPATVLAVYRALVAAGFRPAERGEFSLRAFANGKADLTRTEAIREIIDAKTDEARGHAADRLAGSLSAEIGEIKAMITRVLAAIGVEIEYPEDEETTHGAFDSSLVKEASERLRVLESAWAAEKMYQDGARVVLAGKTNAGKSSLFNALLKEDRAIVSDIHGTTRDWLESSADFSGIPVRVFDTAGLRETTDLVEAEGVDRSRSLAGNADLVLYLVDATAGISVDDSEFLERAYSEKTPTILVWNKADKTGSLPTPATFSAQGGAIAHGAIAYSAIPCSAKTGAGIEALVAEAARLLMGDKGERALRNVRSGAPGSERQKIAIETANAFLVHAIDAATQGFPMDAIEQDLEEALSALGEITGEVTSSDILDAIFSGFCVGK